MGWLQKHLETFVQPVLGFIPTLSKDEKPFFSPQEMAIIKGMWRSVKTEAKRLRKPILLAGRDVFVFEILARREGTATVFRPDISRLTAQHITEDYSQHFLFDTGFMGSIPRMLKCSAFTMGSSSYTSGGAFDYRHKSKHAMLRTDPKQVFPRMKGARSLILKIEGTPKYWRRGFHRTVENTCVCVVTDFSPQISACSTYCYTCGQSRTDDKRIGILQDQSDTLEFLRAAVLTIQVYKDSSPAFVDGPVEVARSKSVLDLYGD